MVDRSGPVPEGTELIGELELVGKVIHAGWGPVQAAFPAMFGICSGFRNGPAASIRAYGHDGICARAGSLMQTSGQETPGSSNTQVAVGAFRGPEIRDYSENELRSFDGSEPTAAVLIGIKGKVYDVTPRADLYGVGGPYGYMTGKDASRLLAKMAKKTDDDGRTDLGDLTEKELKTLNEWEAMFAKKYQCIGNLTKSATPDVW